MSKLDLITAPSVTPISLAEVKTHLRWDDAAGSDSFDSDAYLTQLIDDAIDVAETETWSRFCTQTWEQHLDAFPDKVTLPYPPALSITDIKYQDTGDNEQTLATSVYELGDESGVGIVRLQYGETWPATLGHPDVVVIKYVCGYGVAAAVPDAICHALKLIVTSMATHRGDVADTFRVHRGPDVPIPAAARILLSQYSFRAIA